MAGGHRCGRGSECFAYLEGMDPGRTGVENCLHCTLPASPRRKILRRFATHKSRKGGFIEPPLADGATEDPKNSRLAKYSDGRNLPGIDGTSRLSPFLAAGIISPRACLRAILERSPHGKMPMTRDTGLGSWTQVRTCCPTCPLRQTHIAIR